MARIGKVIFIIFMFLIILQSSLAIDDVDRTYFQQQMEKLNAQYTAKLDSQTNRIEQNLQSNLNSAKQEIKNDMVNEVRNSLRSVGVGLAGLIIITLAIFKVIDLKISSTKNIKKYENLLHQKTEELNKLILSATMERNELAVARDKLLEYQKRLMEYANQIQATDKLMPTHSENKEGKDKPSLTLISPFEDTKNNKKKEWKSILMITGFIIIIVIAIGLLYRYFFMG